MPTAPPEQSLEQAPARASAPSRQAPAPSAAPQKVAPDGPDDAQTDVGASLAQLLLAPEQTVEERPAGTEPPAETALRAARPALWWPTLLTAGILCFVAFLAGGGLRLAQMTTVELVLTIGSGALVAGAVLLRADRLASASRPRGSGLWPVGLLLGFTALTALSVIWSVQPDESWQDAGRMLAYSGVFAASVVLVRVAPDRWPALLGGVTLAAVVVCAYALLTKVFPAQLDPNDTYARLRAPYDYWNAIGLTAAMGVICCMWLGARRTGHALLGALAYPAMGLTLVTLLLAYSRGALVALVAGLVAWLCLVPLRLRGVVVLLTGAFAAAAVVAWDFSRHALSAENVELAARTAAGHQLGVLLVVMVIALTLAGLAIGFCTGWRPPPHALRRRAGALLLIGLALAVLAFAGALTLSHRGLTGTISHDFSSLTNPNAKVPPNTPGRLTAIASVRARYWNEALEIFEDHPVLGAGAGAYRTARLRYRAETLEVRHAHGYIAQTLADLGLVGLALTLALLLTWMAAAGRATHPFNRRWTSWREPSGGGSRAPADERRARGARWLAGLQKVRWRRAPAPYTPERIGLLTMLCVVVVFGVHSLADWTWYVPGDACVALICAGWLAGRGELDAESTSGPGAPRSSRRLSLAIACAALVGALLAAWAQWQPLRSEDAAQEALSLVARSPARALAAAHTAIARDPLSVQALFTLAKVQQDAGESALAQGTLQQAVRLQPSNPQTWQALGEYDLSSDPTAALNELRAAIYLDPESIAPELIADGNTEAITIQNDYLQALRTSTPPPLPLPRG